MGESTLFIEFMLEAILKACEDELVNGNNVPINVPKNVPLKRLDKILSLIADNSSITINQLAQACEVSDKTIKRDISKLKEQGLLERQGSLKSGSWKL
jgi:predicted HTH transcriptional regulator